MLKASAEASEIWRARYQSACADYHSGTDSVHVFRARLYGLGFRGVEIETEINLHYPEKVDA